MDTSQSSVETTRSVRPNAAILFIIHFPNGKILPIRPCNIDGRRLKKLIIIVIIIYELFALKIPLPSKTLGQHFAKFTRVLLFFLRYKESNYKQNISILRVFFFTRFLFLALTLHFLNNNNIKPFKQNGARFDVIFLKRFQNTYIHIHIYIKIM